MSVQPKIEAVADEWGRRIHYQARIDALNSMAEAFEEMADERMTGAQIAVSLRQTARRLTAIEKDSAS